MTGAPEVVLVRGQVIVENDELVAQARRRPVREARPLRRGAPAAGQGGGAGMSDEQAQRGLREGAGSGESVTLGLAPGRARRRLQLRLHRSRLHARLRPDRRGRGDEAPARRRPGEGPAGGLHDDRLRAEPQGRRALAAEGAGARRARSSAATGSRSTRGSSRARTRRSSLKKGASAFFGTNLAVDPRLAAGRLGHPLRRDDERLHPRDRGRPAPVRLADARPARVRRRPGAGAARGEPVRHPGQVRGRRLARGRARLRCRPCPDRVGVGDVTHRVALLPGRRGRAGGDRRGPEGGRRAGPCDRVDRAAVGLGATGTSTAG